MLARAARAAAAARPAAATAVPAGRSMATLAMKFEDPLLALKSLTEEETMVMVRPAGGRACPNTAPGAATRRAPRRAPFLPAQRLRAWPPVRPRGAGGRLAPHCAGLPLAGRRLSRGAALRSCAQRLRQRAHKPPAAASRPAGWRARAQSVPKAGPRPVCAAARQGRR